VPCGELALRDLVLLALSSLQFTCYTQRAGRQSKQSCPHSLVQRCVSCLDEQLCLFSVVGISIAHARLAMLRAGVEN